MEGIVPFSVELGRVDITGLGLVPNNPTNDATPHLDAAVAFALANGCRRIYFPQANYYFNTQPITFTKGITLMGDSKSFSVLNRAYQVSLAWEPFLYWDASSGESGGGLRDLAIRTVAHHHTGAATTSGIAVKLYATSSSAKPDFFEIHSVVITGATVDSTPCTWHIPLYIDGINAPAGLGKGQGIRNLFAQELHVFNATNKAIYAGNTVHTRFQNCFTTEGGGTTGDVYFSGFTDPNTDSSKSTRNAFWYGVVGGQMDVQNSEFVYVYGTFASTHLAATTRKVLAQGELGVLTDNSTSSITNALP